MGLRCLKEDMQNFFVFQAATKEHGGEKHPLQDFSIKRRARCIYIYMYQMQGTSFGMRINN